MMCFHSASTCIHPLTEIHEDMLYIWVFLDFTLIFLVLTEVVFASRQQRVSVLSAAAFTDTEIFQNHYRDNAMQVKPGWKSLWNSFPWGLVVFDGTFPVAINDLFGMSCFVLSESVLFAITVNLFLIKKQRSAQNLVVYIVRASRRGSFLTFAKDLVASHAY